MTKNNIKRMLKAVESDDVATLTAILDADPDAVHAVGDHNRNVRDKTALMYAMQCRNARIANLLLDRGADASAVMSGGPPLSVMELCIMFAVVASFLDDEWVALIERLIALGADPTPGLGYASGGLVRTADRVKLYALLLRHGADPDAETRAGCSFRELVRANRHRYAPEILELFGV